MLEPLKVYCITCLYFAHAFQVATGDEWVEIFFFLCPTDPLSNSEQFRQTLGLQNRVLSRTFNIRYKFFCQFLCLFFTMPQKNNCNMPFFISKCTIIPLYVYCMHNFHLTNILHNVTTFHGPSMLADMPILMCAVWLPSTVFSVAGWRSKGRLNKHYSPYE